MQASPRTPFFSRPTTAHTSSGRPFQQAGGGDLHTEEEVRDLLLTDPADPLIIPVVGQSGSGKSHLVRWLKASLTKPDGRLHVVHIPKYETSLKRVIEKVIAGFHGSDFNEVRARLGEARDQIVEEEAPGKLLNDLALRFELWRPEPDGSPDLAHREHLAGPDGMASLLYDRVFREPLLAEDGIIRRFVNQALHGKREVDHGEPLRFDPNDLPATPANVKAAAPGVQSFYTHLIGDRTLLTLAAAKLTEFLQPAVRDLIGVDAQQLGRLFQRVRELLAAEGKELILLIEDFTVLQAIQRELLDALLIPSRQEGREIFCPLRAVLAVTTGYFADLEFDTVRTRIRLVLDLDVQLDDIDASSQIDFVGRYLNAARLGESALDAAVRGTSTSGDQDWVPNACDDCEHKGPCHDAFGTSQLGHGLYPFNAEALKRCLGSQLGRPDVQGRFDPRVILKDVLEYTLQAHRDALAEGTFPNNLFSVHFKNLEALELSAFVEKDIEAHDPATAARRKVLLTFWGNSPPELANLHPSIHEAFDIAPCGVGVLPPRPKPPLPPPPPPPRDIKLEQDLQDFAKWRKGEALPQSLERRLRGLVHDNVVAHMDWERLVPVPKNWTGGGKAFSTDRILFRDEQQRQTGFIYLTIDRSSANDALAIEGLLKYEHYGDWSFENGARSFRSLRIALGKWAAEVREQLESIRSMERVPFKNAIHALILGAIACGLVDSRRSGWADLMDAIFAPIPESSPRAEGPWEVLRMACARGGGGRRDSRDDLQARVREFAGTSKGRRGPQMVDAATILPVLREKVANLEATPAKSASDGASQHLKYVLELLPKAVAARRDWLKDWEGTISTWCDPDHIDAKDALKTILATVDQARTASVSVQPYNAYELLQRNGDRFVSRHPPDLWREIATGLREFDSLAAKDRLAFLAQQSEEALLDVRRFVRLSDDIIRDLEERVAEESEGSTGLVKKVNSAIEQLHREFEQIGAALESVAETGLGNSQ